MLKGIGIVLSILICLHGHRCWGMPEHDILFRFWCAYGERYPSSNEPLHQTGLVNHLAFLSQLARSGELSKALSKAYSQYSFPQAHAWGLPPDDCPKMTIRVEEIASEPAYSLLKRKIFEMPRSLQPIAGSWYAVWPRVLIQSPGNSTTDLLVPLEQTDERDFLDLKRLVLLLICEEWLHAIQHKNQFKFVSRFFLDGGISPTEKLAEADVYAAILEIFGTEAVPRELARNHAEQRELVFYHFYKHERHPPLIGCPSILIGIPGPISPSGEKETDTIPHN